MISQDAKLLAVYDKLEKQIKALQLKHGVDGKDGADGISIKGDQGDRGHDGVGHEGKQGVRGADGADGTEGTDGVSITSATIDFDNHLVIKLSDGTEIDAGVLQGGSGGDQYISSSGAGADTLARITHLEQSHVKTYQFELDNFKKGNTAPSTEYVGTAPRITTLKFDSVLQRVAFTFMIPLDWDSDTDMQFMCMVAVPAGVTHNVGDIVNLTVESHVARHIGVTKLDGPRAVDTTQTISTSSPYYDVPNDNVMLAGKNTEYYTYMPHIMIPVADIGGVGGIFYGEIGLNSIAAGNVPSILIYQLHINYFGLGTN